MQLLEENPMHTWKSIASSVVFGMILCSAAFAAPAIQPAKAPPAAPATVASSAPADCYKLGGEVSALIDKEAGSTNIAAARSVFQVGVMDCMEGNSDEANDHYREAKKLLSSDQPKTAVSTARP